MNTKTKKIIKFLGSDLYRLNNLIRHNGVENAIEMFLEEMPKTTAHYEINAYVDCKFNSSVAYSGWDMLGGSDPDRFIVNGRECHTTWDGKPLMEKVNHPEFYKKYKYTSSIENENVKIHLYTL